VRARNTSVACAVTLTAYVAFRMAITAWRKQSGWRMSSRRTTNSGGTASGGDAASTCG
jgi:hypothetical protein